MNFCFYSDLSLGFRSRGHQKPEGATFFKYNIGYMQQPGDQTWNGGPDFKWWSGHHWTPLATALFLLYEYGFILVCNMSLF